MSRSDLRDTLLRDFVLREPLFTSAEVVARTGAQPDAIARRLHHLVEEGLLTKVMRGLWANTAHTLFSPYLVVGRLQESWARPAYVSFISALHLHGILSQIPREVHIATDRPRPTMVTPVGRFVFHQLQESLLIGDEPGDQWDRFRRATAEKALFDTTYASLRRGRQWRHLPELEIPASWDWGAWTPWIAAVEAAPVRIALEQARSRLAQQLAA